MRAIALMMFAALVAMHPLTGKAATPMQECLIASLETADDNATVGSLRSQCEDRVSSRSTEDSLLFEYIRSDADIENRNYLISVH